MHNIICIKVTHNMEITNFSGIPFSLFVSYYLLFW